MMVQLDAAGAPVARITILNIENFGRSGGREESLSWQR